jgi:hypothetical protein
MRTLRLLILVSFILITACDSNNNNPVNGPITPGEDKSTWELVGFEDTLLLGYFEDSNNNKFAFTGFELFKDNGLGTFEIIPETIDRTGLAFDSQSNTMVSVQDSSAILSTDAGISFSSFLPDSFKVSSFVFSSSQFIFSDSEKGLFLLEITSADPLEINLEQKSAMNNLRIISRTEDSLYIKEGSSIKTLNITEDNPTFKRISLPTSNVNSIHSNSSDMLFATTRVQKLLISNDDGETWIDSYPESLIVNDITDLIFDQNDRMYMSILGGGVFYSDNNGSSWNSITSPNLDWQVYDLEIAGDYLFASTATGLYRYEL